MLLSGWTKSLALSKTSNPLCRKLSGLFQNSCQKCMPIKKRLLAFFCLKEKSKCIKRKNSNLSSRIFLAKTKKEKKKNPKDECITKNLNTPFLTQCKVRSHHGSCFMKGCEGDHHYSYCFLCFSAILPRQIN